jgi:ferredoxin
VRVRVDHDLCEGYAKCEAAAPAVFAVHDDDLSYVLVDDVPPEHVPQVERAIRVCPKQAIGWVDPAG